VKRETEAKRDLLEAGAITLLLMLYSNGLTIRSLRGGRDPEGPFRVLNPLFLLLMLAYARLRPGLWHATGLRVEGSGKSAAWGLALGLGLAVPPLLFFYRPILLDTPLEYGPVAKLSRQDLLAEIALRLSLNVALMEEFAFRGLLYGILRRSLPAPAAIAGGALAFAGWHVAVTATSVAETNLSNANLPAFLKPFIQPLSVLGGLLSTGIAGALFGLLRERTGNLAGPVVAHWTVDSLMVFSLWWRNSRSSVK
jgi:uncharacterized protein